MVDRRTFLGGAAALVATLAAGCGGDGTARGGATTRPRTATTRPARLADIDHVVIFLQENRSFDQYFGTRADVRGFGDPDVPVGADGRPVWYQPASWSPDGYVLPWHADSTAHKGQCVADIDHTWEGQHAAWNGGAMDGFGERMGANALAYYDRADLPLYSALADGFTVCDAYHCSVMGPTNPNRYYSMTGTIDAAGRHEGPKTGNDGRGFTWETYPERLQRAGVSWRVYHEEDDYDDNCLKFFKAYEGLDPTDPLYENALKNRPAGAFAADAASGDLPQVSWIVAPTEQSEHPPWAPSVGEALVRRQLAGLWSNPGLWARTLFVLTFDENGGFFDHVPPPTPEPGTPDEFVGDQPIGLGARVPTLLLSPWTTGARVCSDVFDHTSTLQFLEARFGVEVPNLSAWRRDVCGDLTSALDLSATNAAVPDLPDVAAHVAQVREACDTLPAPLVPSPQSLPRTES